jgi:hypothetical protein
MAEETTTETPDKKSGGKWYKEMIGPLPAGAWIAVIGAGLVFSMYARKKGLPGLGGTASGTSTSGTATGASSALGTSGLSYDSATGSYYDPTTGQYYDNSGNPISPFVNGASTATGGGGGTTSSTGPSTVHYTNNDDWRKGAETSLIASGHDPASVDQALQDYLNGAPLNAQEDSIVSLALMTIGPTPSPVPPSQRPPQTVTQPPVNNTPAVPSINIPNAPPSLPPGLPPAGESITDTEPAGGGYLFLTDKGGVYATGGARFYGSYLGDPQAQGPGPNGSPASGRRFVKIQPLADGGYTLISNYGERYTFGPGPGEAQTK